MKHLRDPAEIGKILRSLRGIRIRTGVARELGVSYSMMSKIEDGLRIPGEELMVRIANYYGKSVDEIFYTN